MSLETALPVTVSTIQTPETIEQISTVDVNTKERPFGEICDTLLTFLDQDDAGPLRTAICTETLTLIGTKPSQRSHLGGLRTSPTHLQSSSGLTKNL